MNVFNTKKIMSVSAAAMLGATTVVLVGGGVHNVSKVGYKEPEFYNVVSTQTMGSQWLRGFVSTPPHQTGVSSDRWRVVGAERTLVVDKSITCVQPQPMPPYVVDSAAGSDGDVTVAGLITHAGMSRGLADLYEARATDCNISFSRVDDNTLKIGSSTYVLFAGDAVVSVTFNDGYSGNKNTIVGEVFDRMRTTLIESKCVELNTTVKDAERNMWYRAGGNKPHGLFATKTVHTTEDTGNTPTLVEVTPIAVPKAGLVKPEAPYPPNFPDLPAEENKVVEPTIPPFPQVASDTFSKDVTFEIPDDVGAGCGWGWAAGAKTPDYNREGLKNIEDTSTREAQNLVDKNAREYLVNYVGSLRSRADVQPQVVAWNKYATVLNGVYDQWDGLNQRRDKLRPQWEKYVDDWEKWATFEVRKDLETREYLKEIELCDTRDKQFQQWVDDGGETKAPRPAVCGDMIRPEIMGLVRGAEPVFSVPADTPIPNSWVKPGDGSDRLVDATGERMEQQYGALVDRFADADKQNRRLWENKSRAERALDSWGELTGGRTTRTTGTVTNSDSDSDSDSDSVSGATGRSTRTTTTDGNAMRSRTRARSMIGDTAATRPRVVE